MGVVIQFPLNTPKTVKDVYDAMRQLDKNKLHYIIGSSLEFLERLDEDEKAVVKFLITNALEAEKT